MTRKAFLFGLLAIASSLARRIHAFGLESRSTAEPYAPYSVSCPIGPSARPAVSLSLDELSYVLSRQLKADVQLQQWLEKTLGDIIYLDFGLPRMALALSGGGPKAGLITAGVVQALDARDSPGGVGGLLQSMTYMSALSGGSLTLSGLMTNDFATISSLKTNLYNQNYQNPFLLAIENQKQIQTDINAKTAAGYPSTLVDVYGRAISYNYIGGTEGGNGLTWSNITTQPAFHDHDAPLPIITLTDTDVPQGQCFPNFTGPIWEFSPYDFGSWDPSVSAFYPTKFLGTAQNASANQIGGCCTENFDNVGFFTGISSNILPTPGAPCATNGSETLGVLASVIYTALPADLDPIPFGLVPNPFFGDGVASSVRSRKELFMLDGGDTGQGIPIFPFLQPEREVDVIFVIDAESSAATNITDGSSLYDTYQAAHMMGLTKMPVVPDSASFLAQNLSQHASFFGCDDAAAATLIYIPDTPETGYASSTFFFSPADIDAVFEGGFAMATQFGDAKWPACMACGILHKQLALLPDFCDACLEKYCWKG